MSEDVVAIISNREDAHARAVAKRLREQGRDAVVLDLARFPLVVDSSVWINGSNVHAEFDGLDLARVKVVWLRRIGGANLAHLAPEHRAFAHAQVHAHVLNLAQVMDAHWVNRPEAVFAQDGGSAKLLQLLAAARSGMAVPRTCATSDAATASGFCKNVGAAIYKPYRGTREQLVYTTRVGANAPFEKLANAPGIFQEEIPKRSEVRVVQCGDRMLATEILSQADRRSALDFRQFYAVPHRPLELPEHVQGQLRMTMRRLGLSMGVHDLIRRDDRTYVYLETNQQGQWLWLQKETGQDYVGLVADYLAQLSVSGASIPAEAT